MRLLVALAVAVGAWLLLSGGGGNMSADEARSLVADGARLVDVRTPEEFAAGHIEGAVNIPVQELERRMAEVGAKDTPIVLYCRSGKRSSAAARMLEAAGYGQVHDLGSIGRW